MTKTTDEAPADANITLAAFAPVHQLLAELPRDDAGRVLGDWHVSVTPSEMLDGRIDARCMYDVIRGDVVDRAIALGCEVTPGPRPKRKPQAVPQTPAPKAPKKSAPPAQE